MQILIDINVHDSSNAIVHHIIDTGMVFEKEAIADDGITPLHNVLDVLRYFNEHPEAREKAGWNIPTRLPNAPENSTRWDALVEASNSDGAEPELSALNLR